MDETLLFFWFCSVLEHKYLFAICCVALQKRPQINFWKYKGWDSIQEKSKVFSRSWLWIVSFYWLIWLTQMSNSPHCSLSNCFYVFIDLITMLFVRIVPKLTCFNISHKKENQIHLVFIRFKHRIIWITAD